MLVFCIHLHIQELKFCFWIELWLSPFLTFCMTHHPKPKVILNKAHTNLQQLQLKMILLMLVTEACWTQQASSPAPQCCGVSVRRNWKHLVPCLVKERARSVPKSEREGAQQLSATVSPKCSVTGNGPVHVNYIQAGRDRMYLESHLKSLCCGTVWCLSA